MNRKRVYGIVAGATVFSLVLLGVVAEYYYMGPLNALNLREVYFIGILHIDHVKFDFEPNIVRCETYITTLPGSGPNIPIGTNFILGEVQFYRYIPKSGDQVCFGVPAMWITVPPFVPSLNGIPMYGSVSGPTVSTCS